MSKLRESLWLPAAVLAIGIALTVVALSAADRQAPAAGGAAAYPTPPLCLFLPLVKDTAGAGLQASEGAFGPAPQAAYPIDPCAIPVRKRLYLSIVYR
jgi:hypothetical protein